MKHPAPCLSEKKGNKTYVLCNDKYLPDYPVADTTPFVDNGYQTDSVTLIGYLRNLPSTRPFEVDVPDMITNNEEEYTTEIDSLGRFTLRFPVLNSHNVFIDWGRTTICTSVEPGETYFLYVDFADKKKLVMGRKGTVSSNELPGPDEGLSEYIGYDERRKNGKYGIFAKTTGYIVINQNIVQRCSMIIRFSRTSSAITQNRKSATTPHVT